MQLLGIERGSGSWIWYVFSTACGGFEIRGLGFWGEGLRVRGLQV